MTKTLFLHIGVPKTGTTSIQESFFTSDDALKRHDVAYFKYSSNHGAAIIWLFAEKGKKNYHVTLKQRLSERELEAKRQEVDESLRAFLTGTAKTKIISGEIISELSESEVEQLRQYIQGIVPCEIKIIVYVRNYYDFLDSRVQERVKNATTLDKIEAGLSEGREAVLPKYQFRIEKFIKLFGRENVIIRVFDSEVFKGRDVVADFCDAIDKPELFDDLTKIRANNSVSDETVRILSKYNEFFPLRKNKTFNPERTEKIRAYFNSSKGTKFRVTDRKVLAAYEELIAEDKEFIRECLGEELAAHVLRPRTPAKETSDAGSSPIDLDYLFRTLGKILLDVVNYESALKVALVGLTEDASKDRSSSLRKNIKFIGTDDVCRRLSRAFLKVGKIDHATALLDRAIELDKKNAENYMLLGDLHWRQKAWEEAERAFRRAIQLDPSDSTARRKLSGCLSKLGRRAQAASVAQEAVELSPDNEGYQRHLHKLTTRKVVVDAES